MSLKTASSHTAVFSGTSTREILTREHLLLINFHDHEQHELVGPTEPFGAGFTDINSTIGGRIHWANHTAMVAGVVVIASSFIVMLFIGCLPCR
jgi:hypothetical protein